MSIDISEFTNKTPDEIKSIVETNIKINDYIANIIITGLPNNGVFFCQTTSDKLFSFVSIIVEKILEYSNHDKLKN